MVAVRALTVVFLALLLPEVYANGKAVKFHNCKSKFSIKEVRVDPCDGSDSTRCPLKKGTAPRVYVTFTPDKEVRNLTATVHGIIASIPAEFQMPNRHACSNSGLTCPLEAGKEYTYTQSVPILSTYPSMNVLVRWALDSSTPQEGDEKKHDVCFIIKAQVVD